VLDEGGFIEKKRQADTHIDRQIDRQSERDRVAERGKRLCDSNCKMSTYN
jgi:hypothetical protein